jgi:hypothetical protein
LGLLAQAVPAVHAPQKPLPSQTWLAPQLVPALFGVESTQVWAPLPHEVMPVRHAVGLLPHPVPAVQAVQAPALLQTRLVPQLVPGARCTESTQVVTPVEHDVTPVKHAALGLVPQLWPALQAAQVPEGLQTWLVPHTVPGDFEAPSTQVWLPVAHEVMPVAHAFGLPEHPRPAVHDWHWPLPLQTWLVPHETPAALFA